MKIVREQITLDELKEVAVDEAGIRNRIREIVMRLVQR